MIATPESGICQGHGDPHYTTWDGANVDYQGPCRHVLAEVCGDTTLEYWSVVYVVAVMS